MNKIRASVSLLFLLTIFSPLPVLAAATYQRSPSGANVENPISTLFSFENLTDIGCFPDINFWQIVISFQDATFAGGIIRPISELNGQDKFTLPFLTYDPVDVYGAMNNEVNENGVLIGDCGETIGPGFTVVRPTSGTTVHTPIINFFNIPTDKYIAGVQPIEYSASDEDEKLKIAEHGLKQNPVNIYYSPPRSFEWFLVAKDQPASGTILWDTSKLPDGNDYRLKATVIGADNDFNQIIIDSLTLDNTPPHFTVSAQPKFSKGEPIKIEIESSEILKSPPELAITQFDYKEVKIPLTGDILNKKFSIIYEIIPGFDGTAEIKITGEDSAGNKSGAILGDSSFAVGIKPPPAPEIEIPANNVRTSEHSIPLIKGFALNAERIILKINGFEELKKEKLKNNNFQFENITLDPKFNKGRNILTIISQDQKGRKSEPALIEIFVNSPPEIVWLEPRFRLAAFNGLIKTSWRASDINDNSLTYQLELSDNRGQNWKTIAKDLKQPEFMWDSSSIADGSNYILKITASDGSLKSSALSKRFGIANNLPAIILETGGDFFTNETSKIFKGIIRSKNDFLAKLEYSADNDKNWQEISSEDGKWDSQFERFSFEIPELKTGAQNIVVKGLTVSGRTVINAQNLKIIFDNKNPVLTAETLPKKTINKKFLSINGVASDDIAGIKSVEYSIDNSKWYKGNITTGSNTKTAEFKIKHPKSLADGSHQIAIKAFDFARNVSIENMQTIIIDATPPRFGGFMITSDNKTIYPTAERIFTVRPKTVINLKIALSENPEKIEAFLNNETIPVQFNQELKLRQIEIKIEKEGWFILKIAAEDKLGNKNEKEIARIQSTDSPAQDTLPRKNQKPKSFRNMFINLLK